jgi:ABC-type sugar transport system substrate-binding protein
VRLATANLEGCDPRRGPETALRGGLGAARAQEPRRGVAFANLTEEPGVTVEGTGFTGREIRESFTLAARAHPVEMVFYDNQRDDARAVANAEAGIARKVDLYIQYHRGAANAVVAEKLKAAGGQGIVEYPLNKIVV